MKVAERIEEESYGDEVAGAVWRWLKVILFDSL
jgi:hypothetical protein